MQNEISNSNSSAKSASSASAQLIILIYERHIIHASNIPRTLLRSGARYNCYITAYNVYKHCNNGASKDQLELN